MWVFSRLRLVVQSLASVNVFDTAPWQKFIKTLAVAHCQWRGPGRIGLYFCYFSYGSQLAMVVSLALFSVVVFASLVGTIIPLILDKLGFNPRAGFRSFYYHHGRSAWASTLFCCGSSALQFLNFKKKCLSF
jgi:hypothetical protein